MKNWTEQQEEIRACNLAWIEALKIPYEVQGTMLSLKVEGKRIDFWPYSDTWFSHSKNRYGCGIANLCKKIKSATGT